MIYYQPDMTDGVDHQDPVGTYSKQMNEARKAQQHRNPCEASPMLAGENLIQVPRRDHAEQHGHR